VEGFLASGVAAAALIAGRRFVVAPRSDAQAQSAERLSAGSTLWKTPR